MKKLFTVIFLLLFSMASRSQVIISLLFGDKLNSEKVSFGLLTGVGWNNLTGYGNSSWSSNFNLGLYINFKFNDRWILQFDAMAKYKLGAKNLPVYSLNDPALDSIFKSGSVERDIKYLSLATTIQYRFFSYFNLELGPQISLRLKATDIFFASRSSGELSLERKVNDATTLFDLGIATGISYQFIKGNGVKIAFRYYYGFINVILDDPASHANRSIQLNGYIPIGRGKALRRENKTVPN